MKKTVTANIAGTVFHIEEDAYEQLQRYLAGIRANFSGSAGADEIMADIESRIAELFTERLTGRNVVTLADEQHVEGVMGRPEDFAGETTGEGGTMATGNTASAAKGPRRFLRDPDDKWVGGVIGGIAAYVGTDPLWFRIAFILAVYWGWGTPLVVYILLWILVPKAGTAAEKLQMRGEPVTVENIKRVVEEGGERFKQGAERMADEAKEVGKEWGPRARQWGQEAGGAARKAGSGAAIVIRKIIGIAFILFAFSLLMGLIAGLAGGTFSLWSATWSSDDLGIRELGGLLFTSPAHALWFGIGVIVLCVVPVIGLFLAGFRLLIDSRTPQWLSWTLAILWFGALVPTAITGADLGTDFRRNNKVHFEEHITQPVGGVLYLDALANPDSTWNWDVTYNGDRVDWDFDGLHVEKGTVSGAWAQCDIAKSPDSLYHLLVMREARARTAKNALARATHVTYSFEQKDDALLLSPWLSWPEQDKLRAQYVRFTIQVPLGGAIFLRQGSSPLLDDIDNVSNTLDEDMVGRTWTMTVEGLKDLNAPEKHKAGWDEEAPKDTVRRDTLAATPWEGPSKRRATSENKSPARAQEAGYTLPNLLQLLRPRI